jgi:hypothetical protein
VPTRALVDAFLRQDPEFAPLLHGRGEEVLLGRGAPELPPDREAKALRRTKRLLHGWDWLMFMAILFSCFAFGRIVADTSWDVSPVNFIVVASRGRGVLDRLFHAAHLGAEDRVSHSPARAAGQRNA